MTTRIYLASPVEPSGASWLVNCFLELGIRVSHKPIVDNVWRHRAPPPPPSHMWERGSDGRERLKPRAAVLKKWLPALSRIEAFAFRDDVEVEYVQDLPSAHHAGTPVLLLVRDPRDSLYSMYRRVQPEFDYDTFLRMPSPDTLHDRPAHWRLFVEGWLALAGENWFTFEEYKQDAAGLLHRILRRLGAPYDDDRVERAVLESSYDAARAAEARYRTLFPGDWEVANRAGRAGAWVESGESRSGAALIALRAGALMRRLGYECAAAPDAGPDGWLHELCGFASAVDEDLLRRSKLPNHRIRQLLEHLARVARARGWHSSERLAQLQQSFMDGSGYQLAQVRDLLARRRMNPRAG